jgi:hypothetical protein
MPEADRLLFELKELAEVLVKAQDIHEGFWGIYVEFGLGAANVPTGPGQITPAAISFVQKIGIQRFTEANSLTVDARQIVQQKETQGSARPRPTAGTKAARKK